MSSLPKNIGVIIVGDEILSGKRQDKHLAKVIELLGARGLALSWGWRTYRVFAFDVLAAHGTAQERRLILRRRHWPLLAMGVVCGFLGAAPSLLWALSAATLIFAPLLAVLSVWLYTLVFTFAACWFAHYALAALQSLRGESIEADVLAQALVPPLPLAPPP